MKARITALSFLTAVLISCQTSFGDKYTIEQLDIYYTDTLAEKYVVATGEYFQDHGLIQAERHSVQLATDDSGFVLRMILKEGLTQFPGDKMASLLFLENEMKRTIFDGQDFRIEPTDEFFVRINPAD